MEHDFWGQQTRYQQNEYIEMLKILGSLSNLFSDNASPYLYYRAHENLFCSSFDAKNLSRGDVSYDATKGKMGIGLKTFLNNNGRTFQKVAEFNNDSDKIRSFKNVEDIVHTVAELRNKRINVTQNMVDTEASIYHLITREPGRMNVYETGMDLIDINSIRIPKKQGKNTIKFEDKLNEYSFSLSKNTLLKRFDTTEQNRIITFNVEILENPFDFLKSLQPKIVTSETSVTQEENYIILPLYSPREGKVPERSGLNQWNAKGRPRHHDEVYISIPSWIHREYKDFFVYSRERKTSTESAKDSPSFDVELPNGRVMNCKVAQAGGKALMSNPNKELGEWILRDVLKVKPSNLVTMEMLDEIGIDSVKLTKKSDDYYYLDFVETGSYEDFQENSV